MLAEMLPVSITIADSRQLLGAEKGVDMEEPEAPFRLEISKSWLVLYRMAVAWVCVERLLLSMSDFLLGRGDGELCGFTLCWPQQAF